MRNTLSIPFYPERRIRRFSSIALTVLMLSASFGKAQSPTTQYLLHYIPQTNLLNPAVQSVCNYFVGLPFLGSVNVNYANSSFSYNDLADGNTLDLDNLYNSLYRMNLLSANASVYPVYMGYLKNDNYYTIAMADRVSSYNNYSKQLAALVLYGNAQFVGETARFNNTRLNGIYFREYSFGWAVDYDRYTSLGIRGKLLFGKLNLNTGASRLRAITDKESFDLRVNGTVVLNSSLPISLTQNASGLIDNITLNNPNYFKLFMNARNPGFAVDLGVVHRYSSAVTLSASILDLGAIFWTDDTYNVKGDVDFLYEGVQEGTDFSAAAYFRDLADSIVNDIIYDVTQTSYISPLPLQTYIGASYRVKKNITLGAVARNVVLNRRIIPSFTLSGTMEFINRISTTVSWSYMNNTPYNLGAAIAYTGQGMQFFAATDNFLGMISPLNTRSLNLRFGLNILLGCPRDMMRERNQSPSMLRGTCNWSPSREPRRRR